MIKVLFRKQMLELNRSFFQNKKDGKARSHGKVILSILGFAILMIIVLGGMFALMSMGLVSLFDAGVGWLYFTIMSILAILLGTFGSVFNTYASLYQAKDNDFLLSLPIPVQDILIVRLSGVFVMGLMYSAVVMVPAVLVYIFMVSPGLAGVIGSVILMLMISIFVLVLSCILGWAVAKVSHKLKNRGVISTICSLAFLGLYYYFYFQAADALESLLMNAIVIGEKIRGAAYPLYVMGMAGTGDVSSLVILSAFVLILLVVTCYVLLKSFLQIATGTSETAKVKYKEKKVKKNSVQGALFSKELNRYLSSSAYMLNCSLGSLMLILMAGVLLFKGQMVMDILTQYDASEVAVPVGCALICAIVAMNDIAASAISMEGTAKWILPSLPVTSWQILQAKLRLHIALTMVPSLLCSLAAEIVFRPSWFGGICLFAIPMVFTVLTAAVDLMLNLRWLNFSWTRETAVVKQGAAPMLALLINLAYVLVFAGMYLFLWKMEDPYPYLAICLAVTAALTVAALYWLKKKGTRRLEEL